MDADSDTEDSRRRKTSIPTRTNEENEENKSESIDLSDDDEDKRNLVEKITSFILEDLHSPTIINERGFRKLIQSMQSNSQLPSLDSILNRITEMYSIERANLFDELHSVKHVSISLDKWLSTSGDQYITVIADFITPNWDAKSKIIANIKHFGALDVSKLQKYFREFFQDWDISNKIVSLVFDKSILRSDDIKFDIQTIPCLAETIKKSIETAIESISEIGVLIRQCERLISHFHLSNSASIYLRKYQMSLEIAANPLQKINWESVNPVYETFDRLLEQRMAIRAVLADRDVTNETLLNELDLSENEWQRMEKICEALKPFYIVDNAFLRKIKSSMNVVSVIKPLMHSFCIILASNTADSVEISHLKKKIINELKRNFNLYSDNGVITAPDFLDIATFLDPRYKEMDYLSVKNRDVVRKYVKNKCLDSVPSTSATARSTKIDEMLKFIFPKSENTKTDEWTKYVSEPEIDRELSVYQWWKLHEKKYPNLAKMAEKYLCTRASSKPFDSEQLIKRRTFLTSDYVDKCLFLNHKLY